MVQFQVHLCVYPIQVKGALRHIQIGSQRAFAQCGATPLKVQKEGGAAQAHNGEFLHRKLFQGIRLIGLGQGQGLANVPLGIIIAVCQTFPRPLGHAAGLQLRHIDPAGQAQQAKGGVLLGVLTSQKRVDGYGALGCPDARLCA